MSPDTRDAASALFPGLDPASAAKRAMWRLVDADGRPLPEDQRAKLVSHVDDAVRRADEKADS